MSWLRLRIPLRFQVTILLAFFVTAVAVVSFQTTFSVFENDKLGSVNMIQTLQVNELSREVNDRVGRARAQMRETAIRLLDPGRGTPQVEEGVWSWITVRDRSWKAPGYAGTLPTSAASGSKAFSITQDPESPDHVLLEEPLKIQEGGAEQTLVARGRIAKSMVFGDSSRFNAGYVKGVLIEMSPLAARGARNEAEIADRVFVGEQTASRSFASFFMSLPEADRKLLLAPSQTLTRTFTDRDSGNRILLSWATVPIQNSGLQLVVAAFTDLNTILAGFRYTRAQLMFWSALLLGFGIMAAAFLGGRLSQPIEKMVEAARVLETGDFSVRVKADRYDEIGDLAKAFNHMGESLEQRERELEAAQNALIQNEKMAALGTLSAGIAHEVKNPLAGILGHADMTANQIKLLPPQAQGALMKHIETIQKETKRCRGIIDNLMRFSRKEESTEKGHFDPTDLEVAAWEAIMLVEHPLNMAKVKIEKEFDPNAQLVLGNTNQIEQVILNMLQNAGHAMPEGGTVKVFTEYFSDPGQATTGDFVAYVHPEFQGPFVRVAVSDTGVGMSDEVKAKIFEPFFTTKPRGQGTGLGLSVTMTILADHRARVSLNSTPGKGTTFLMDFMAAGPRSAEVNAQLEEIRHKKSGGQKLATDISVVTAPAAMPQAAPPTFQPQAAPPVAAAAAGGGWAQPEGVAEAQSTSWTNSNQTQGWTASGEPSQAQWQESQSQASGAGLHVVPPTPGAGSGDFEGMGAPTQPSGSATQVSQAPNAPELQMESTASQLLKNAPHRSMDELSRQRTPGATAATLTGTMGQKFALRKPQGKKS